MKLDQAPSAYPFVDSPDALAGARKHLQLAGIVNLSILVSVALLGLWNLDCRDGAKPRNF